MGMSRDTPLSAARPLHLANGASSSSSSSSSALPLQNADLPDDTLTEDTGNVGVSSEAFPGILEEPPPGQEASARLQAEGRPPPGEVLPAPLATLEAQGRPPPPEAPTVEEDEESFFLDILPSDPGRFEIMARIPTGDPSVRPDLAAIEDVRRIQGRDDMVV